MIGSITAPMIIISLALVFYSKREAILDIGVET